MGFSSMRLVLLYISFKQKFGPLQVAANLLENILNSKKLTVIGIVDEEIARVLPSRMLKALRVSRSYLDLLLHIIGVLKERPAICHFNFLPPPFFIPLLILLKVLRVKIVYSFHGGVLLENKNMLIRALFIIQSKHFFDVIVANSRYSFQLLLQAVGNDLKRKIIVIPNGIKIHEQVSSFNSKLPGNPAVLYVGRIDYVKGVDVLIRAIALAKEKLPRICLHIVGDGPKLEEIKKLILSLNLKENVVLHGFVDGADKNKLFLTCDIVAVPSRSETFSITVLEAMRAGKPLIVSNRGALPELVKHEVNGLIVELKPQSFADAILRYANDKALVTLISKANRKIVSLYDWEKITEKYMALYMSLIDRS